VDGLLQDNYKLKLELSRKEMEVQELRDELVLKNKILARKGHDVDKIDFFLSWVYAEKKRKISVFLIFQVALFWKSQCATCISACVILYHVNGS